MLNQINFKNFKCFSEIDIPLNMLNVFSGLNGMGKSTTIQSLLLIKQSIEQGFAPENIILNGNYVNLGTGKDLLYENAENDDIEISIFNNKQKYKLVINYDSKSDVLLLKQFDESLTELFNCPFEYLNAERLSPKSIYPRSSYYIDSKSQLGIHGEYATHYLSKHQDDALCWDSCDGKENSLKGAVQYWLNEISPNVKLNVSEIENTDLAQLGYYYTDNGKTNIYRPENVGFGITYILPVIVAIIKAQPNSVLIIENPEAHLHPKGQRKMGELLSRCAANGIQVFVETHSDHVLNGIRISVKNDLINCDKVNFLFFSKTEKNNRFEHIVENPKINMLGKLDYWPEGFFDEWDKALDEII